MSDEFRRQNQQGLRGQEIFEVQPVMLGGDPIDPKNKIALDRHQHIDAVRYWNNLIRELRAKQK
jgi:hypothetical protein